MKNSVNENAKKNDFRFLGPERYYHVAGRQLDEKTNDGTDDFVNIQGNDEKTTFGSIIAVGIVAIAITSLVCIAVRPKAAEKLYSGNLAAAVYDEADIIGNDQSLSATLDEYLANTGICPVVYTVYDEEWKSEYDDLQTYALHVYADNYSDLQHFVVVCSIPENEAKLINQGEAVEAHYEVFAINGPGTNAFISESDLTRFCDHLSADLNNGSEPSAAFEGAFRKAINDADSKLHPYKGGFGKIFLTFLPVLIVTIIFVMVLVIVSRKYKRDRVALKESVSRA